MREISEKANQDLGDRNVCSQLKSKDGEASDGGMWLPLWQRKGEVTREKSQGLQQYWSMYFLSWVAVYLGGHYVPPYTFFLLCLSCFILKIKIFWGT